jgi:hypothetical protein
MKRTFSVVGVAALAISSIGVGLLGNTANAAISTTDQVTLSLTVDQNITLNCGANVDLGTLTAGTPVNGTSTCTTTTNAESGYDLAVRRDDADTTLDKTTSAADNITDKTAWDPTANTGNGNAATWSGTGLGFRVVASGTTATHSATWWGADGTPTFAGFPTAYATIMDHDTYSATSTAVVIAYRADVSGTQRSGAYDGSITYQATTKP